MEPQFTPPSPDHIEFDLLCSEVGEFEPLPSVAAQQPAAESLGEERVAFDGDPERASLDGQILAGLVTP